MGKTQLKEIIFRGSVVGTCDQCGCVEEIVYMSSPEETFNRSLCKDCLWVEIRKAAYSQARQSFEDIVGYLDSKETCPEKDGI